MGYVARYGKSLVNYKTKIKPAMLVHVSPSVNISDALTYQIHGDNHEIYPGLRVVIPIGNRLTTGWVIDIHSDFKGKVKNVIAIVRDKYNPDIQFINYIKAISHLYFVSMGGLLDSVLSPKKKSINSIYFKNQEGIDQKMTDLSLSQLQDLSKNKAIEAFYKQNPAIPLLGEMENQLEKSTDKVNTSQKQILISYNREDQYLKQINTCLNQRKSVLIIVPDNLTSLYLKESLAKKGLEVDIYNSEIKIKEREILWHQYTTGQKSGIIVGGLSAVLLPMPNCGLLICDRAGSSIYKRTYYTKYNVHQLSRLRVQHQQLPYLEGFSSPPLQFFQNSNHSDVKLVDDRKNNFSVNVHMIKAKAQGIPEEFLELVNNDFTKNKKVLIVLNKKESSQFLYCNKCKKVQNCSHCNGFLNVSGEKDSIKSKCQRCDIEKMAPHICNTCNESLILIQDVSISSVKNAIKQNVVDTGINTISAEELKKGSITSLLDRVKKSSIVIATTAIVNPFFKNIFDGIIYFRPESFFNLDHYDAAENIYSLIAEFKELLKNEGTIDIFSTFHFHYSLKLINNEKSFFERELKYREWFHLPPFYNVYNIVIKGKEIRKLAAEMRKLYQKNKETFKIKKIYLSSRQPARGMYKFKGIIEVHALPEDISKSGLLKKRNISIELLMV